MTVKLKRQIAIFLGFVSVLLIGAIALSLLMGVKRIQEGHRDLARQMGVSFFQQLVLTRRWVALHNGVYVPLSDLAGPNPYLDDPQRDLVATDGTRLTKINPAYMTRLLSEMASQHDGIQFKITSLRPLNPDNAPDAWEREALLSFEAGEREHAGLVQEQDREAFRYMGALMTEQPCLKCHGNDGYVLGSVRGGIRVSVPYQPFQVATQSGVARLFAGHLAFLSAGLILIWLTGWILRRQAARVEALNADMRDLNAELRAKNEAIEQQNAVLDQALVDVKGASRAKNEFLANMSHEIRTPMNALVGFGDFLSRTGLNPEQRDALSKIQDSSRLLLEIINDVLDYADLEAGRFELALRPFALRTLVQQIRAQLDPALAGRDVELICHVGADIPAVLIGDAPRLTRVLSHLLGNAVKFTERGRVSLRIERTGSDEAAVHLRFEVRDTGIGMDRAQLGALFQPFVQADSSSTRRYGGVGLGLVICRAYIERMGGTLAAESTLNVGSVFRFALSMQVESPEARARPQHDAAHPMHAALQQGADPSGPPTRAAEVPDFKDVSILLVEDNLLNQEVAKRMLAKTGASVTIANHGAEALDLLNARRFDLVLMDLQMPVMDGFEATRRLRERFPDLPVIALTAAVMEDDRARARAAGVNAHLGKPVDMRLLFETLAHWLLDRDPVPSAASSNASAGSHADRSAPGIDQPWAERGDQGVLASAGHGGDDSDSGGLRPRLEELWRLLDTSNLRALDLFAAIESSLRESARAEAERLAEQIRQLDFAAARASVSELLARPAKDTGAADDTGLGGPSPD